MGKAMSICQRIIGILFFVLLIVSIFIPRYALKSNKIAKAISSTVEDYVKKNSKKVEDIIGIGVGDDYIDKLTSNIEDSIADGLNELEENNVKIKYSFFDIVINSPQKILYEELGGKLNFSSIDEMMEEFEKDSSDEEVKIIKGGIKIYNILRILILLYIFLIVLIFAGIMIEWFTKIKRWIYLIFVWTLCLVETSYFIIIQFIIPNMTGKILDIIEKMTGEAAPEEIALLGIDIDSLVSQFIRKLLWCFHSSGYYLAAIVSVLFFMWSIWCVICKEKKQIVSVQANTNNYAVSPSVQDITGQAIPVLTETKVGIIRGLEGVFKGADISLEQGEKIFIGRDPSDCQIVLPEANISRKHFSVEFNQLSGMYHIKCFSSHGLKLSNNMIIEPSQELDVVPGTEIIMAKGQEVLLLL